MTPKKDLRGLKDPIVSGCKTESSLEPSDLYRKKNRSFVSKKIPGIPVSHLQVPASWPGKSCNPQASPSELGGRTSPGPGGVSGTRMDSRDLFRKSTGNPGFRALKK